MTGIAGLFASGAGAGLIAGGTSCAAAQLGLLAGAVGDADRAPFPVSGFLAAKLATHTVLGAVLGAAGSAMQPGPRVRAVFLCLGAALLVVFALDLLGLRTTRGRLPRRGATSSCPAGRLQHESEVTVAAAAGVTRPRAPGHVTPRLHRSAGVDPLQADSPPEPASSVPAPSVPVPSVPAPSVPAPSRPGHRWPVRSSRVRWWLRPSLLGAATVLAPCGLTLSAELLAVGTRSMAGGAAVMAGFVIGTAPSFGLLGVGLRRGLSSLRGTPAKLIGVVLVCLAGWTLLSGLRLGGWLPASHASAATDPRFVQVTANGTQVITIWAVGRGYRPAHVTARPGIPTVLIVRAAPTAGCTRALVIPSRRVERVLPAGGRTSIDLGSPVAGQMKFVCASGHYPGSIDFRAAPPPSPRTAHS